MFGKLRDKLSGWFKKKPKEEVAEEPKEKVKKKIEKKVKKKKEEKKVVDKKPKEIKKVEKEVKKKEDIQEIEKKIDEGVVEEKEKVEEVIEFEEEEEVVEEEPIEDGKDETKIEEKVKEEAEEEEVVEDIGEVKEEVVEEKEEKKGFFFNLKKKLLTSELKQEEFDEIFEDFEMTLLENNVALEVVDKIKEELGKDLVGASLKKKDVEETIVGSLKKAILSVLVEGEDLVKKIEGSLERPYVILFFGINGSGKTTSVAKLAWKLKEKGISCVLAAADTFRAASIEQLETHGKKIGVDVVKSQYGADPASVAFDAIRYAKKHKKKVVLIDTAGRMYTKANLMKEMEKIVRVSKPHLKIFVGESITGNDATEQAKMFNESAGIDGIILSKADVDEKAGAILSVGYVTGKPILFLGTGQDYKDLEEFTKEGVLGKLGLD